MQEFYAGQIDMLKDSAHKAHLVYAAEVVKNESALTNACCGASRSAAETALAELDAATTEFKKNKGADLKKLVS